MEDAATSSSDTLYLIDGSAFIYRAYFALRVAMAAVDGTPNAAVFGFVRMLINTLRDKKPTHVAVVFDMDGDTFRHALYPAYKATRKEPPQDLVPQFDLCRRATRAFGIPAIEVPRYEADDVIGTLARLWTETGRRCVVVSQDKDLTQLVDERTTIWDGKDETLDRQGVIDKMGVPPERVIDVLGLAGDSSDNVPGVPGIGPKNAVKLVQTYGGLEEVLAHAHEVGGKRGASLAEFAEQARLSRVLCTIERFVDLPLDEAALTRRPFDPDVLVPFLREMSFKRFLDELGLEGHGTKQLELGGHQPVLGRDELQRVAQRIRNARRLCLGVHAAGPAVDAELLGLALCWGPGEAVYVPFAHRYADAPAQLDPAVVVDVLRPALESPEVAKLGEDLKGAWRHLKRLGVELRGLTADTAVAAYLLDANRGEVSLDDLSTQHLGHASQALAALVGPKGGPGDFAGVRIDLATSYACERVELALRICDVLVPRIREQGLWALNQDLEMALVPVLAGLELWGVRVDTDLLARLSADYAGRAAALAAEIHEAAGEAFNIDSPKQLAEVLFDENKLNLTPGKKLKTGYSTDQSVLEELRDAHVVPGLVLAYRHLTKLRGTYLEALPALANPRTGRVHTTFHQAVAATGRLSSSDPNLQNIPIRTAEGREIRRAFVAEPGWKLISADYSQVELRLLAHYSNDPALMQAFADDADVHAATAAQMFNLLPGLVTPDLRRKAKTLNFGLMYGMGPFRLGRELGVSQQEAKALIDRYFDRYEGVKRYFDEALASARETRQAVTLFGRVRPLPDINTRKFQERQAAERLAINTPIQGTAADILKRAMVNLDARLRREQVQARMVLTVHDELLVEAPEAELGRVPAMVREEMEGAAALRVRLKVDVGVGDNWAEIH